MKKILLASAAALTLAACGGDGPAASPEDINAALTQLSLRDSGSGRVEFEDRSESGNDVVFRNVMIRTSDFEADADEGDEDGMVEVDVDGSADLKADEMIFTGLNVDDAGMANFSRMVMNAIEVVPTDEVEAENASFTIGQIALDGPSAQLAAWLGGVFGHSEAADLPDTENMSFDGLSLTNLLVAGEDDDSGMINLSVASIEAEDYGPETIGSFAVDGVSFAFDDGDESGTFTLGKISVGGVNSALLNALMNAEDEEASADLMSAIYGNPMDPGFDEFSLENMNFNGVGLAVALDDLSYDVTRNSDGVPTRFLMPEFTLTVDADAEGGEAGAQVAPMLLMVGLERIVLSGSSNSTYDPETDISTTESSSFAIEDVFTMSSVSEIGGISAMASALEGMDPDAFVTGEQDPQAMMMEVYSELDVHQLSFTIRDEGLLDKVFAVMGPQQGMTAEDMRGMAVGMTAMLPAMTSGMGIDQAIATDLATALRVFLSGEQDELTISFNPETSFALGDLMADPTLLTQERLGFTATAN